MTVDDAWIRSTAAESRSLRRRQQLQRLLRMQRAAEHVALAEFLERRADVSLPVLASLLRERAAERRAWGEQLVSGSESPGPGPCPGPTC